jgi:hypothetical protein
VDVHDGPPEEQEIISERIVDVINDTDVDLDLLNNVTNTEGSTSSFPSTLSSAQTTNTLNSSPSSTSFWLKVTMLQVSENIKCKQSISS